MSGRSEAAAELAQGRAGLGWAGLGPARVHGFSPGHRQPGDAASGEGGDSVALDLGASGAPRLLG